MARNFRTFDDGVNHVNGYVVNVTRFVGAQQSGANSRIAAKYWGTITTPDGEVIDMGENGKTVTDIKKVIGGESRSYSRYGENSEIKKLESLKNQLAELGMDTSEVDAKIEAKKAEIEAAREASVNREANKGRIKELNKDLKKYRKLRESLVSLGMATTEVDTKIYDIEFEISSLS